MTTNSRLNYPVCVSTTEPFYPKRSYHPSVPLSVYRELVKELQATQSRVEHLELQNQQLQQQIEQIIEATQQLKQVVEPENTLIEKNIKLSLRQSVNSTNNYPSSLTQPQPYRVDVRPYLQRSVSLNDGDQTINGWLLGMAIFLIVLTSCTGAFLIVNSKFTQHNR